MALRDEGASTLDPRAPDTLSVHQAPEGRAPEEGSPTELTRGDWKAALSGTMAHAKADRMTVIGGSLAFRWFLSLFPTIIVLLGVTSLLRLSSSSIQRLIHGSSSALPQGASNVINQALTHAESRTSGAVAATVIAAVVALYSALSGMTQLQQGLNIAHDIPEDRKFIGKRLVGLELMVAMAVLGGLASALMVFGSQIGHGISGHVGIAGLAFDIVWTVVRWVVALFLLVVLFGFLYWQGPNRTRPKWQWITPGSIVAAVLWALASLAFSFYTSQFGSYAKTYGAFAGVAILILWLYVTALVVLLGAELNAELERRKAKRGLAFQQTNS